MLQLSAAAEDSWLWDLIEMAPVPLAARLNTLIQQHAGYQLGPARYHQLPWSALAKDAPLIGQSFLALFGADYAGVHGAGNVGPELVRCPAPAASDSCLSPRSGT